MDDRRGQIDVDAIKSRVGIVAAVQAFCPNLRLKRQGREFVGLSPFKTERTPSFTVDPRKNLFHCFASGQGGDAIQFVRVLENCDFRTAAERLANRVLGSTPLTPDDVDAMARRAEVRQREADEIRRRDEAEKQRKVETAEEIWAATRPADGTIVQVYLAARGIDLAAIERLYGWRIPESIRFAPKCSVGPHRAPTHVGPAMVGRMVDVDGRFTGVHRTFLTPDGSAKAAIGADKLALGKVWGSMGVLAMPKGCDHAISGEGYETTLTVLAALARIGARVAAVSALNLGNLVGAGLGKGDRHPFIPGKRLPSEIPDPERPGLVLPAHIKSLTLLEDADGSDPVSVAAQMARGTAKFRAAKIKTRIATPERGKDFNDMAKVAA